MWPEIPSPAPIPTPSRPLPAVAPRAACTVVAAAPHRRALILSVDFGASAFAAHSGAYMEDSRTGGGIYGTALWRFIPYLAVGVHGGVSVLGADDTYYDYSPLVWAVGVVEARGYLPLGRLDIWGSLGIGYAAISQQFDNGSVSVAGPALSIAVGMDYFFSRIFSLGVVGRIYRMFPTKYCAEVGGIESCNDISDVDSDTGIAWYFGLAATYHFPLSFGRRSR